MSSVVRPAMTPRSASCTCRLDPRVDRARGVIEDEDARVVEDGSSKRYSLALTSRQRQTALTDRGVVPARQLRDEVVCLGGAGGGLDLRIGRVGPSVGDVRSHRVGEQEAVLEDDTHLTAQRSQRDVAQVMPVDEDRSAGRVVEARDEHRQRRLAAPAGANEGDAFTRGDVQIDPVEHRISVGIPEVDVRERDLAGELGEVDRVGWVGNGSRQVQELEDALEPCPSLLADGQDARQLARRRHELGHVRRERQEGTEGDLVLERQPPAEGEDRHLSEQGDRLEEWLVPRLQAHRSHLRAVHGLRGGCDSFELALLLTERLDHTDAVEVLVDDLDEVTFPLLPIPGCREDAPPHAIRDDEQARRDHDAHQSQQRREIEHHPEREQQQQDVAAHDREEAQEPLDQGRIGVGASDQLACWHSLKVVEVQRLQVVVHRVAQVVLHFQSDPPTAIAADVRECEAGGRQSHQQEEPRPQRASCD